MAVDVYSDNFIGMNDNNNSPRFSFSKDVQENETINPINGYNPYRLDHSLVMDSPFDFAFNVDSTTSFQSSTADELFSDGKILPTCVKKDNNAIIIPKVKQDVIAVQCLDPHQSKTIKKSLKEFLEDSSEEEEEQETSNNAVVPKPFWMFRRSNSLNCDNRNQKKGLIGSWKILSRSGSTGKFLEKILEEDEEKPVKNPRFSWKFSRSNSLIISDQNANFIGNVGNNKGANTSVNSLQRSSSTNEYFTGKSDPKPIRRSNSTGSAPNHLRNKKQKQQEMGSSNNKYGHKVKVKNGKGYDFGSYYSNSGKISPVLNLPSPYISRVSVDLFGMGSLFCNSSTKDRKKKK